MAKTLTPEQLDAVTIVIDQKTNAQFYLVQSATDPTVTYQVRWNKHYSRYSCQCEGSAIGYVCWHMRAALQVGSEHAEAKRAEAEAIARQRREEQETLERVLAASPAIYSEAEIKADQKLFAPRPFSILRSSFRAG